MSGMRLAIAGAGGRMGRALTRIVHEMDGCEVAGGLEAPNSPFIGADMGELAGLGPIGAAVVDDPRSLFARIDGVIDFTSPAVSVALAELAAETGIVDVIGTTGFSREDNARIEAVATRLPIVKSGNMSLGVNLLAAMVRKVAAALDESFDIEIVEMHHRNKVDAPSGTALLLGEAAAAGRNVDLQRASVRVRDGHTGARERGTIGFATLRGGSVIGDHNVIFAGDGERIELGHRAENRDVFARGAVKAALWARGRKPGLYSMADMLGLTD